MTCHFGALIGIMNLEIPANWFTIHVCIQGSCASEAKLSVDWAICQ